MSLSSLRSSGTFPSGISPSLGAFCSPASAPNPTPISAPIVSRTSKLDGGCRDRTHVSVWNQLVSCYGRQNGRLCLIVDARQRQLQASGPVRSPLTQFSSETPRAIKRQRSCATRPQTIRRSIPFDGSPWPPSCLACFFPCSLSMTMKDPSLGSTRVHSKDFSPTRPQRHPVHRRLATYALYLVSALLSATCIALYARRGFVIPHAYALCSPSGIKAIYTVSSAQPVVQCMVVNGSRIQDVGSLGSGPSRAPMTMC